MRFYKLIIEGLGTYEYGTGSQAPRIVFEISSAEQVVNTASRVGITNLSPEVAAGLNDYVRNIAPLNLELYAGFVDSSLLQASGMKAKYSSTPLIKSSITGVMTGYEGVDVVTYFIMNPSSLNLRDTHENKNKVVNIKMGDRIADKLVEFMRMYQSKDCIFKISDGAKALIYQNKQSLTLEVPSGDANINSDYFASVLRQFSLMCYSESSNTLTLATDSEYQSLNKGSIKGGFFSSLLNMLLNTLLDFLNIAPAGKIEAYEVIAQPTWINPVTVSLPLWLSGRFYIGQEVTIPSAPGGNVSSTASLAGSVVNTAASALGLSSNSLGQNKIFFGPLTGVITAINHIGDSHSASPNDWATVLTINVTK